MAKIDFESILRRINGISTPVFGISWNPSTSDTQIARNLILYLEDKRALYYPFGMEIPFHVNESILEIRSYLTDTLQKVDGNSKLIPKLKSMRAACRKYLDDNPSPSKKRKRMMSDDTIALGELRGICGLNIAEICVMYGIDPDEEISVILPVEDDEQ